MASSAGHTPRRAGDVGDRRPPRCWRSGTEREGLQESGSAGDGDSHLGDVVRGAKAKNPPPAPPTGATTAGWVPTLARCDKGEPCGGRSREVSEAGDWDEDEGQYPREREHR